MEDVEVGKGKGTVSGSGCGRKVTVPYICGEWCRWWYYRYIIIDSGGCGEEGGRYCSFFCFVF